MLSGPEGHLYVRDADGMRRLFEALGLDAERVGDSSEGSRQGLPPSSLEFVVAIHDEVRALCAELSIWGGCARFVSDDGYACGPAHVVFDAVARFVRRVEALLSLEGQWGKFSCFSRRYDLYACPHRARYGVPVGTLTPLEVSREIEADSALLPEDQRGGLLLPVDLYVRGSGRGIMVGGVPLGDEQYEALCLWQLTSRSVSSLRQTSVQLRSAPHHQWSLHHYCHAPELDYWLRHLPPATTRSAAERWDAAMEEAFEACTYAGAVRDHAEPELVREVLQAAVGRQTGAGIGRRSRVWLAPIAFTAGLVEAADEFLGVTGYFPMLAALFGTGDAGFDRDGTRFETFSSVETDGTHRSDTGHALARAWEQLQAPYDEVLPESGPLSADVGRIGEGHGRRLQHALTHQLEQLRASTLRARMLQRPSDCRLRRAYMARDRISMQWAATWPTRRWAIEPEVFSIGVCLMLGLPLGALRHRVGQPIPCSQRRADGSTTRVCDAYGEQLSLARQQGAHWDIAHDSWLRTIEESLRQCGIVVSWTPSGIFATVLPERAMLPDQDVEAQRLRGIVPDLDVHGLAVPREAGPAYRHHTRQLFDGKMLHGGDHECYRRAAVRDSSRHSQAVEARAAEVHREYERAARQLDDEHHAGEPRPGPVLRRLREFPPVRGLVLGAHGEVSTAVHAMLAQAGTLGAERGWRTMCAATQDAARSFLVGDMRRTWSVAGFLASARLVAWRLGTVGLERLPPRAAYRGAPLRTAAEQSRLVADRLHAARFAEGMQPAVAAMGPRGA